MHFPVSRDEPFCIGHLIDGVHEVELHPLEVVLVDVAVAIISGKRRRHQAGRQAHCK